jgi:hypothetical protein
MNAKEFAAMLNGREYRNEITRAEEKAAKEAGLIVAFGASDDNLELRGAVDEELSAYDGTEAKIRLDKLEVVTDESCPDCLKLAKVIDIKAEWSPKEPAASWLITASVPFEPFDIMEDGELFCRGAVIPVTPSVESGEPRLSLLVPAPSNPQERK